MEEGFLLLIQALAINFAFNLRLTAALCLEDLSTVCQLGTKKFTTYASWRGTVWLTKFSQFPDAKWREPFQ